MGRPIGSRSDRATVLARKVLWGKRPGDNLPRAQRLFEKFLDGELDGPKAKDKDIVLKALLALMSYGHDKPAQRLAKTDAPKAAGKVMVLPDKKSETDWMAEHGQDAVVDLSATKPN